MPGAPCKVMGVSSGKGSGMKWTSRLAIALVLAATLVLGSVQSSAAAGSTPRKALVGGRLIDGFGGQPVNQSVVLVEGDRIVAVGREGQIDIPPGTEVISTEGMDVLPGLWEAHAHLMIVGHSDYDHWDKTYPERFGSEIMPASAHQLLMAGVTSARDLGAPLEESIAIKRAIENGEIPGPTLYVSGPFIQHEPYPGTERFRWGVEGVEDARAKVKRLADAGVDFIKLIDQDQMTMDEVHAVVEEAHAHGLPVVAHAHRPEEIRRGIAAGVDCFEHTGLGTMPEYPPDVIAMIESRANTLFWTPTITPLLLYEQTRDNPERIDDPAWHLGLAADTIADVEASLQDLQRLDYYQLMPRRRPTLQRKFSQLRNAGVVMLIGTDSGVPLTFHTDSTWREIDYWVRIFEVPVMEAIQAATYWPAVQMSVADKVGTVSPGKIADIIAVRGDVLTWPSLLQDVDLVMQKGNRVK
jgi:imidazolonepropionase-like amidohydrolase